MTFSHMTRPLYRYRVVQSMKAGMSPRAAIQEALSHISEYYTYTGAMIAVNIKGEYGTNEGCGLVIMGVVL